MNTLTLSPVSGRLSEWAVRAGLGLARWGRRRVVRWARSFIGYG